MRPSRFKEEQIIETLREQVSQGATAEVCRKCKYGISSATFHKWGASRYEAAVANWTLADHRVESA